MAAEVRNLTQGKAAPDYRIRALNTFLYKTVGIQYDLSDPYVKKLKNRYINGILDNNKGSCVSMPLLYLAVAQRLGYPIYPVSAPGHLFVRYVHPNLKMQNIETTGGGGYSSDDEYIETLKVTFLALMKGTYLKTMTYREFISLMIEQNGIYQGQHQNIEKAIKYLEIAVKLNPRAADSYRSLGLLYLNLTAKTKGLPGREYLLKTRECFTKAEKLGATQLSPDNYVEVQRKAQEKFRNRNKGGIEK